MIKILNKNEKQYLCWKIIIIFSSPHPRVSKPPQTLDELGESLALWEQLNGDQSKIEAKFQPLYDQLKKNIYFFIVSSLLSIQSQSLQAPSDLRRARWKPCFMGTATRRPIEDRGQIPAFIWSIL